MKHPNLLATTAYSLHTDTRHDAGPLHIKFMLNADGNMPEPGAPQTNPGNSNESGSSDHANANNAGAGELDGDEQQAAAANTGQVGSAESGSQPE